MAELSGKQQHNEGLEPQLQEVVGVIDDSKFTLGLVANYSDSDETRFLLTPEGCGLLTSSGIRVKMEKGAATDISFPDSSYKEYGVEITGRGEALKCDVVLSYQPLTPHDIHRMNKGATLFTMMGRRLLESEVIKALLDKQITYGCLDNMYSHLDEPIFSSIIEEIDGRSAIIYAQEFLSYVGGGKGVLLAGVAGINPCEVLIIGDGTVTYAAAKAA